jgi:MFS family permease
MLQPLSHPLNGFFCAVFLDLFALAIITPFLPSTGESVGLTRSQFGLIQGLYGIAQMLATPVMGIASDRFGRRRILTVSFLGSAVGWGLTALALEQHSPALLISSRILIGATRQTMSLSAAHIAFNTNALTAERATMLARLSAVASLAFVLGPSLAGYLTLLGGLRTLSWVSAAAGLLGVLALQWVLPKTGTEGPVSLMPTKPDSAGAPTGAAVTQQSSPSPKKLEGAADPPGSEPQSNAASNPTPSLEREERSSSGHLESEGRAGDMAPLSPTRNIEQNLERTFSKRLFALQSEDFTTNATALNDATRLTPETNSVSRRLPRKKSSVQGQRAQMRKGPKKQSAPRNPLALLVFLCGHPWMAALLGAIFLGSMAKITVDASVAYELRDRFAVDPSIAGLYFSSLGAGGMIFLTFVLPILLRHYSNDTLLARAASVAVVLALVRTIPQLPLLAFTFASLGLNCALNSVEVLNKNHYTKSFPLLRVGEVTGIIFSFDGANKTVMSMVIPMLGELHPAGCSILVFCIVLCFATLVHRRVVSQSFRAKFFRSSAHPLSCKGSDAPDPDPAKKPELSERAGSVNQEQGQLPGKGRWLANGAPIPRNDSFYYDSVRRKRSAKPVCPTDTTDVSSPWDAELDDVTSGTSTASEDSKSESIPSQPSTSIFGLRLRRGNKL